MRVRIAEDGDPPLSHRLSIRELPMAAEADLLDTDEELGASAAHRRDWKGIITALIVIFAICVLIFLCGYIFTPLNGNEHDPSHYPLNLTDFKQYRPSINNLKWLRDGRLVFETIDGLSAISPDEQRTILVTYSEIHDILQRGASAKCNFDCSFVSLTYALENPSTNPENSRVSVHVLNLKTKSVVRVTRDANQPEGINFMQWSPNGIDYLFSQNGRLYYVAEAGITPVDISLKGDTQINGFFDWMTEEEIFGTRQAVWWSKNGSQIAFASRDKTTEPSITLTSYRNTERYQLDSNLFYPKTGEKKLPSYNVNIWDKATGMTKQMDVQLRNSASFHYLFAVSWIVNKGDGILSIVWANRWQNHTELTYCNFETSICKLIFENPYPAKTWALPEEYRNLGWIATKENAFLILPRQMPDGNSYQHISRIRTNDPTTRQFLPAGNFDIKSMLYRDDANGLIFFLTMAPRHTQQNLYVTSYKTQQSSQEAYSCVTCSLNCTFVVPSFSSDGKRLSIVCRGPSYHTFYLGDIESGKLKNVKEVFHDHRVQQIVEKTAFPVIVDDSIQLENGFEATTRLLLPRNRGHTRALPLLVYVYGGPGYQTIQESFSVGWLEYIVTNLHIAVLKIDARGSGGRGWKYRSPVYGALGNAEMEDQIAATHLALKKYSYLDPTRVAIHGWSYGGFATLRIVELAPEKMFKCAISGAPVITFQFYDAAYTERYMGSAPRESYVDVSHDDLDKFISTRLLLVHGLSDDNVHFQNSAVFIEAMQNEQIDFDFMPFPNERHHLSGDKWLYGYSKMTRFLRECLVH